MVNLTATIPGAAPEPTIASSSPATTTPSCFKEFTFVGANDGGSSAAFLIELARVLKTRAERAARSSCCSSTARKPSVEWQGTDHTYGSRYYVERGTQGRHAEDDPRAASWST